MKLGRKERRVERRGTPAQLTRLLELGCRFGQGFLLGRPMPPEEMLERLSKSLPR